MCGLSCTKEQGVTTEISGDYLTSENVESKGTGKSSLKLELDAAPSQSVSVSHWRFHIVPV